MYLGATDGRTEVQKYISGVFGKLGWHEEQVSWGLLVVVGRVDGMKAETGCCLALLAAGRVVVEAIIVVGSGADAMGWDRIRCGVLALANCLRAETGVCLALVVVYRSDSARG